MASRHESFQELFPRRDVLLAMEDIRSALIAHLAFKYGAMPNGDAIYHYTDARMVVGSMSDSHVMKRLRSAFLYDDGGTFTIEVI